MKPLLQWLSPAGPRARLSTLIFHRVVAEPDPLFPDEVDARRFDAICAWMCAWFQVLPLDEATARLRDGSLPSRALGISFDDGYADNHDVAMPILRRHGLSATFFVATGFLDGGRMWNDTLVETVRRVEGPSLDLSGLSQPDLGVLDLSSLDARRQAMHRLLMALKYLPPAQRSLCVDEVARRAKVALPDDLMMSSDQVRGLHRAGMQVGAHTVSHPILRTLDDAAAAREMGESRRRLESIVGAPVTLFAYPNGKRGDDYGERDVSLARDCGFSAAFTTEPGCSSLGTDAHQLPRYTPWRKGRWPFGLQLIRNLATA